MEKITVCTGVPEDGCAYCSFIRGWPGAHYCNLFGETIERLDKCEECRQAVRKAKNNGWICVNEQLPGKKQRVLAYSPYMAESDTGPISIQCGFICARKHLDITHWMPLPEPPKEEKHE